MGSTPRPPVIANPLPKELLPVELQSILVRLGQKYGAALRVTVADTEWVEVSVDNLSAAQLQMQLQSERNVLFGTAESRLQVIQPLRPSGAEVYLHLLSAPRWGDLSTMALLAKK